MIYLGSKVDSVNDQAKNFLYIFLSILLIFNKNISKFILIGNFLFSFNLNLHKLNSEIWGLIHFETKRGSKEFFLLIIEKNKKLEKKGKKKKNKRFDLNLRGKNDWNQLL